MYFSRISLGAFLLGSCLNCHPARPATVAEEQANCNPPADVVEESFHIDSCILNPAGLCAGDSVACVYIDRANACVMLTCRKECDDEFREVKRLCQEAEQQSYEEQTEEHGI